MLHLAQVQGQTDGEARSLRLLAKQTPDALWSLVTEAPPVPLPPEPPLNPGMLVLVQVSEAGEVQQVQDACSWVLGLLQTHLSRPEAQLVEQWRRELTLQSQELALQRLEVEARREQIQALEESLRQTGG